MKEVVRIGEPSFVRGMLKQNSPNQTFGSDSDGRD